MKHLLTIVLALTLHLSAGAQCLMWDVEAIHALKLQPNNPLYQTIVKQADAYCTTAPVAVTDKKECRSGDVHNFESLSIYFWPDPEKEDGLPYIGKDGQINPEYKQYDLPRLDRLISSCRILAIAYALTGEKRYYTALCRQLDTWFINKATRMNPSFEYAQFIPGRNGNRGNNAGLIDAYNFIDIIEAVRLVEQTKSIGKSRKKKLKRWFGDFAGWMQTSDLGIAQKATTNNLGSAYDITLYSFCTFSGKTKACKPILDNFADSRLKTQIMADGSQPLELSRTRALNYSLYNLTHIIDFFTMLQRQGKPLEGADQVMKALQYLEQFIGHQEAFPYKETGNWLQAEKQLKSEYNRFLLLRSDSRGTEQTEPYPIVENDIYTLIR